MNKKIELQGVSYVYGERTPFEITALKNVNLNIEAGSVTGIIGHTGSGKSTLVRLLNGLERPASGKVLLDGVDIWEKPKEIGKVRYRVGLVMQYPEYQLFEETVEKVSREMDQQIKEAGEAAIYECKYKEKCRKDDTNEKNLVSLHGGDFCANGSYRLRFRSG